MPGSTFEHWLRPFPDPKPHIFRSEVLTVCYPGSDWWEPTCPLVS